jgi:hypothetical protein
MVKKTSPMKALSSPGDSSSGSRPAPTTKPSANNNHTLPAAAGYLVTCDVPTKRFIQQLNESKKQPNAKFILEDLDATHLLIKSKAREEIMAAVEGWQNSNVFSAVERVGEDLDMS